jgi:aerobic-type carbon monoxide dehydrogenase small subunit (CoxS/CutS family)
MASSDRDSSGPTASPAGDGAATATGPDFSRRNFIKTVGVGPLAAGVLASQADAQTGAKVLGPGEVPLELTVNGKKHSLRVEPRMTLLDALRNQLDMTGQKRVCDRGSCGACTVLVDGRAVYACSMLAVEAAGANIRTVEGLAQGTVLHPVQQALCETDGLMCGFCTPGFVMSTVALLEKTPNPTPEQAKHALDGNICRCGTYPRVLDAALKAAREGRRG